MTDPLYTKDILRLAADIPRLEPLPDPDEALTKVSPICGSRVKASIKVEAGKVAAYGQEVRACALGQAAASIMGEHVVGQRLDSFPALLDTLKTFLKGEGPPPDSPWDSLAIFAPAKAHKSRHASILLAYQAMAEMAQHARAEAPAQ